MQLKNNFFDRLTLKIEAPEPFEEWETTHPTLYPIPDGSNQLHCFDNFKPSNRINCLEYIVLQVFSFITHWY